MAPFSFTKLSLLAFLIYLWQHPNYHQDDARRQGVNASLQVHNKVGRNLASKEEATAQGKNKTTKTLLGKKEENTEGDKEDSDGTSSEDAKKRKPTWNDLSIEEMRKQLAQEETRNHKKKLTPEQKEALDKKYECLLKKLLDREAEKRRNSEKGAQKPGQKKVQEKKDSNEKGAQKPGQKKVQEKKDSNEKGAQKPSEQEDEEEED
ncbi:Uncharacterized protein PKNOH_S100070200 [Plasmodium knowlesi]|uniref:Uncharacterized protein n=1 Tax=Plasmodium knowlesi TaxID=5850 RepID=A0A1Y3DSV4_PLAKN|nr:Uncharacterized protein PKNOH_S100070200 [Plasmodium knowlesi]